LYWTEGGSLKRASTGPANANDIQTVIPGTGASFGISIDTVNNKIYWSDRNGNAIKRANLDGSNIETVANTTGNPDGIVVDPAGGLVYWSQFLGCICSANTNGPFPATPATVQSGGGNTLESGITLVYIPIPPTATPTNTPT